MRQLVAGQLHPLPGGVQRPVGHVQHRPAAGEQLGGRPEVVGPPQHGLDLGGKDLEIEGLCQQVVPAHLHGHDGVDAVPGGGQEQNGHLGDPADLPAPVVAVEEGQGDVQQHQMRRRMRRTPRARRRTAPRSGRSYPQPARWRRMTPAMAPSSSTMNTRYMVCPLLSSRSVFRLSIPSRRGKVKSRHPRALLGTAAAARSSLDGLSAAKAPAPFGAGALFPVSVGSAIIPLRACSSLSRPSQPRHRCWKRSSQWRRAHPQYHSHRRPSR